MSKTTSNEVSPSRLFKNMIALKPWLFITAYYVYSNPGSTVEDLRELTRLNMDTLKRGIWWLNKFGVIENRNDKYFVKQEYSKVIENMLFNYCNLGEKHVLQLDKVYIVFNIRNGRVNYWSLPLDYYEKLSYYEKITNGVFTDREVAYVLGVNIRTARKIVELKELLEKCGINHQTHGEKS
ncbi:MAG: hypothetical protein QXE10_00035 [Desulfurococcaceae archaeon]